MPIGEQGAIGGPCATMIRILLCPQAFQCSCIPGTACSPLFQVRWHLCICRRAAKVSQLHQFQDAFHLAVYSQLSSQGAWLCMAATFRAPGP
mmetsp:Transcript_10691/g.22074  ORF Transcript_10691/g.22074 Transcript_10691/m.22074 type:complete len:92 (-) Transcript_10691:435-710(-)